MLIEALRPMISARLVVVAVDATLWTAASALSNPHIGILVVCDENKKAAGVVSKSDLVRHLSSVGAEEAPVTVLMSRNISSCGPEDDLYATWQKMAAQSLQNIPVLSTDATPLGVLDIRDALQVLFEQEEHQERLLINYIAGVGYQ
jgi:CBS domain-containing protein